MKSQNIIVVLVAVVLLPLATAAYAGETYNLDTGHSHIGFSVRHMGVSSVRGEFKDFTAQIEVDEKDLTQSSIVFEIDAASIDTKDDDRDGHLRNADFLDVDNHPTISFKSDSIKSLGDGRYQATGDLSIHGVTKEVALDLEVGGPIQDPWGNMRIGIEGGVTIDRQDYDVNFSKVMDNGGLLVGNDVKIEFALEAVRKTG
jgi:polyisoprenoid-binding protein YceI